MRPALCILAGGASQRLGECKALVRIGGRQPLAHLLEAGAVFVPPEPLVVAGPHADEIAAALPPGVELARNEAWAQGRTGSVAEAVRRRPGRDLVLAPVDVPLVPAAVFEALAARWIGAGSPAEGWLAPLWRPPGRPAAGRYGHPVLIGRDLAARIPDMDPDEALRSLRVRANPLLAVEVPHPEILDELDTPADLAALRARPDART